MAPLSLPTRIGRLKVPSVLAIVLLGCWLLLSTRGKTSTMPFIPIIGSPRPRVTLRQGTYLGFEEKGSSPQVLEKFFGIPYALSTAGQRRFKPPLPVNDSTETFDAIQYGNRCPAGPEDGTRMSEDCLNLNIYRPKVRPIDKKLPVLVHIYGGAFNFGFGHSREIANMVGWSAEPFIGLSFNYRVGAFGFLPSHLMAKEGLLNSGLKDQVLLLEWVQENIAEFGGDPTDVTLMGNSAGAHSIGHHLMHNPSKPPPFHKVIIESGASTARAVYTPSNLLHEKQFADFLIDVSLGSIHEDYIIQELRYLTSNQIKAASEKIFNYYNPSIRWPFQPVIDGHGGIIAEPPINAWRKGKFHKVPILTGFNTNEGAMFVPAQTATGKQFTSFFRTLQPGLSERDLAKLDEIYPDPLIHRSSKYRETRKGVGAQFRRIEQAYSHFAYTAPVRHTAHFASLADVPVYLYHFAVKSSEKMGADHGSHAGYPTYDKVLRDTSDTINEVTGSMHAYWTSFITTGDPNKIRGRFPQRPTWPIYKPGKGKGKLVMFGEGNDERAGGASKGVPVQIVGDDYAVDECEYWWNRTSLFEL